MPSTNSFVSSRVTHHEHAHVNLEHSQSNIISHDSIRNERTISDLSQTSSPSTYLLTNHLYELKGQDNSLMNSPLYEYKLKQHTSRPIMSSITLPQSFKDLSNSNTYMEANHTASMDKDRQHAQDYCSIDREAWLPNTDYRSDLNCEIHNPKEKRSPHNLSRMVHNTIHENSLMAGSQQQELHLTAPIQQCLHPLSTSRCSPNENIIRSSSFTTRSATMITSPSTTPSNHLHMHSIQSTTCSCSSSNNNSSSGGEEVRTGLEIKAQSSPKTRVGTSSSGIIKTQRKKYRRSLCIEERDMLRVMHLSQTQACSSLGCSLSTLKRRFYELKEKIGIEKWPQFYSDIRHLDSFSHIYPMSLDYIMNEESNHEKFISNACMNVLTKAFESSTTTKPLQKGYSKLIFAEEKGKSKRKKK